MAKITVATTAEMILDPRISLALTNRLDPSRHTMANRPRSKLVMASQKKDMSTPAYTEALSRKSSVADDTSVPLEHHRSRHLMPSKLALVLGLWCEDSGVSRSQYTSLREILQMLEPHPKLSSIPNSLSTLERNCLSSPCGKRLFSFGLRSMRTSAESRKKAIEGHTPTEDLVFFDLKHVLQTFLSADDVRRKMHVGLAEFRDTPSESRHSQSWASSVALRLPSMRTCLMAPLSFRRTSSICGIPTVVAPSLTLVEYTLSVETFALLQRIHR